MLFAVVIASSLITNALSSDSAKDVKLVKPYAYPVPFELPFRNERADQCWLRIEDVNVVETANVFCYMAKEFLENYIHDYNSKTMTEDAVDVSLWSEKPRTHKDFSPPDSSQHSIKDWRVTTVLDSTTHMRLYVSTNADCRLIMYSRDAIANYRIECERILYYFNMRMSGGVLSREQNVKLLLVCLFLVILRIL